MKTGIILFIGTLFFGVIPLQGQKNIRQVVPLIEEEKAPATDTVSLEELKANFKAWYRERDHAAQTPPDLITDDLPWLYKINHYDADLGRKVHYVDTPTRTACIGQGGTVCLLPAGALTAVSRPQAGNSGCVCTACLQAFCRLPTRRPFAFGWNGATARWVKKVFRPLGSVVR